MPTIIVSKAGDPHPPLKFGIDISGSLDLKIWPSTLTIFTERGEGEPEMTAKEVMDSLVSEYGIGTTNGAISFLNDQSWLEQMVDLEITITIEDR